MTVRKISLLKFKSIGNPFEGFITSTQQAANIPFAIKRVFWTYGTSPEIVRGQHAHRTTEQVLVAVQGQIKVVVNNIRGQETYILDTPDEGLYLPPLHWANLYFESGALLLCLASTDFNEKDYIRRFDVFLEELKSRQHDNSQ